MRPLIAITGGIGCGKSTVSSLLRIIGYPVYDCDRRARHLMLSDPQVRQGLIEAFGSETYLPDGSLNRSFLASRIFGDAAALARINSIVHPAVHSDLGRWQEAQTAALCFYESAILFESGFDRHASAVWCVSAPLALRIRRTMMRDHCPAATVEQRIASQLPQEEKERRSHFVICNDASHSVIAQVRQGIAQVL